MNWELVAANLLSAPVLFFLLGIFAALLKTDLEFPQPIPRLLSLYLLFAIGLKGGMGLRETGLTPEVALTLLSAVVLATVVPFYVFAAARAWFGKENAAAIAATYGSVSAVTFITASAFLQKIGADYGGHMVAAMALMESPAIVVGVILARRGGGSASRLSARELLHEGLLNGSVFLLLGSLAIGTIISEPDAGSLDLLARQLFPGVLCLFLLDMGIVAARRLMEARQALGPMLTLGIGLPILNGGLGLVAAALLGLQPGNALMLTVLSASASYIAVPAAFRLAVPAANPGLYVTLALGVTFPFNIAIGIPVYYWCITALGL